MESSGVFIPYKQTCIVDPPLWIIDEVDYHSLIMVFFILEKKPFQFLFLFEIPAHLAMWRPPLQIPLVDARVK